MIICTTSQTGNERIPAIYTSQIVADLYSADDKNERDQDAHLKSKTLNTARRKESDFNNDGRDRIADLGGCDEPDFNPLSARLGPSPEVDMISSVAVPKAREDIRECFDFLKTEKASFDAIPRYTGSDMVIGKHLGNGSFNDAFEVTLKSKKPPLKDDSKYVSHSSDPSNSASVTEEQPFQGILNNMSIDLAPPVGQPQSRAIQTHPTIVEHRTTLVMKRLRLQIRGDANRYVIGLEDILRETAMLASINHPNIIKLHGRSGSLESNSLNWSHEYFILLDRLIETLGVKIDRWQKVLGKKNRPTPRQLYAASSLAEAVSFLHSNNIVFRDLKPTNVGFDANGTLKLFDFGFAIKLDKYNPQVLMDKCGSLRYMAPEVGLVEGYGMEADVYSFGMMLWEICSLKKPFSNIITAGKFEMEVFEKDTRPKLGKSWDGTLKELITKCWSKDRHKRPCMSKVNTTLKAMVNEMSSYREVKSTQERILTKMLLNRRLLSN